MGQWTMHSDLLHMPIFMPEAGPIENAQKLETRWKPPGTGEYPEVGEKCVPLINSTIELASVEWPIRLLLQPMG